MRKKSYLCKRKIDKKGEIMTVVEFELRKASLAREILTTNDEDIVNRMWLMLKEYKAEKTAQQLLYELQNEL
jgi:hypothetical protein